MFVVRRIAAILAALLVVAGAVGMVAADRAWPPEAGVAGSPGVVEVPPGNAQVVCAGSLKLPGDGAGEIAYDQRFDPNPTGVDSINRGLVAGRGGGESQVLDEQSAAIPLGAQAGRVRIANEPVGDAPIRLTAFVGQDDSAAAPPAAAGAVFQHLADGDLRGVAAAPCIPASSEAWVVAGSTETGSSARLLLTNGGLTNVRADLTLWDGAGLVQAVGLTGLTVPPLSQRAVLLEAYVGDARRLAVKVTATGGDLAVFLQHSRLQGLIQGGVELATPGAGPSQEAIVPALSVTESTFDSTRTSAIRVLNPGDQPATVSVELWGPDGPTTLPGLEEALVNPGVVTDLSLGGLPAGTYAALIRSDQPIVAAGLSLRAGAEDQPEEFAWTPTAASSAQGYVVLPGADLDALLVVAAPADTTLELTPIDQAGGAGAPQTIQVAALTSQALTLAESGADLDSAALQFHWEGPEGVLALVVTAADPTGEMISAAVPTALVVDAKPVRVYPDRL
ncbi:MAG: DUF5719 family protein [Bifidobacteriaceae bacterium]|jgi:hypothetical protein|nr:DUF5719 family protein [Bifidobacteriaceae bacterium]